MEVIFLKIVYLVCMATFIPLLLLQFLPAKHTVTGGTLATIKTWRGTVWGLPDHMLSSLGRKLRLSFYVMLTVDLLALLLAALVGLI